VHSVQLFMHLLKGNPGYLKTYVGMQALLSMPCFKSDDNKTVEQARKEMVSTLGENISIRRFVRYTLGEGLAKKSEDFASEVAAQTARKEEAPTSAVCS
jgi:elongation factor Ts